MFNPFKWFQRPKQEVTRQRLKAAPIARSVGSELHGALSEIIPENYQPRPVGRGTEHLVFEFDDPKHKSVVYKVNFLKSLPVLEAHINAENANFKNEVEKRKAREALEEKMLHQEERFRELRKHFGVSAVPVGRFMVRDVPISRETIDALYHDRVPKQAKIPKKIPAWVMVQRRMEIDESSAVSLEGGAPEDTESKQEYASRESLPYEATYHLAHDALLGKDIGDATAEEAGDAILAMYPHFKQVAEIAKQDPAFDAKLGEAVKKFIDYTNKTGNFLDLVGSDNIFLVEGKNGWELKMPDPIFLEDTTMDGLTSVADKIKNNEPLGWNDRLQMRIGLGAIRTMNGLAMVAGIEERLVPNRLITELEAEDWRNAIDQKRKKAA